MHAERSRTSHNDNVLKLVISLESLTKSALDKQYWAGWLRRSVKWVWSRTGKCRSPQILRYTSYFLQMHPSWTCIPWRTAWLVGGLGILWFSPSWSRHVIAIYNTVIGRGCTDMDDESDNDAHDGGDCSSVDGVLPILQVRWQDCIKCQKQDNAAYL